MYFNSIVRLGKLTVQLRQTVYFSICCPVWSSTHTYCFYQPSKEVITRVGLSSNYYNGHSFRSGAATTSSKVRLEDHLIQTLGRWSSDCYKRYIHTPLEVIRDAQKALSTVPWTCVMIPWLTLLLSIATLLAINSLIVLMYLGLNIDLHVDLVHSYSPSLAWYLMFFVNSGLPF